MNLIQKLELIKSNAEEILTEDELKNLLEKKKTPSAYIGITVTGPFHMGYLIPFGKLLDFDKVGIKNIILIADIHSSLDDLKAPWGELKERAEFFKKFIELGFPWEHKPKFVLGSEFQLTKDYCLDMLKLSTLATVKRATRAASEVTRMKDPKVSELIYPLMQSLDEEYLKVDIQLGGIDQRHILGFAREYLPKIGYKPRVEVMTPLIASLKGPGTKMSASIPESNIKVYDSEEDLRRKISKAYCPVGDIKENPIIQLCRYFIFPIKGQVSVNREEKYGGKIVFKSFEKLQEEYVKGGLHPADLKLAVADELVKTFSRVRKFAEKNNVPKGLR